MEPHTRHEYAQQMELGEEVGRFLESRGGRATIALARARIYDEWKRGATTTIREAAFFEDRALDRLLGAMQDTHEAGLFAREAIKRLDAMDPPSEEDEGEALY